VNGRSILKFLKDHPRAGHLRDWKELVPQARRGALTPGVLLTMGAGDITHLGPMLLAEEGGP
jgi:UDP-N-acetylmuramate-alanine ligase